MEAGASQNLSNIIINSSFGAYEIKFQSINLEIFTNHYFLIDHNLKSRINSDEKNSLFIEAIESHKSLKSAENVMVQLSEKGMTKNHELVVIGGGYLQDIGTLISSLYMRGVKWSYIPTTLAAMGDSCVGGKSSINAGEVKNLVGNFYPPKEVLIDPSFVSTLPNLEIIAGISEIIKICFARSYETFTHCSRLIADWTENSDSKALTEVIQLSLGSKKYFVEEDEFDSGIRKLLNFGHSFGHALESASDYRVPHGVAVLIGMIAASQHPRSKATPETETLIFSSLTFSRMIGNEIVDQISSVDFERFSKALSKDKKNTKSNLVLILPMGSGLEVCGIPFEQNALEEATNATKKAIEMVLHEIR
jgi:3-dehydroquinate synthase